jgi:hypothetical protein
MSLLLIICRLINSIFDGYENGVRWCDDLWKWIRKNVEESGRRQVYDTCLDRLRITTQNLVGLKAETWTRDLQTMK